MTDNDHIDLKTISRNISRIENRVDGFEELITANPGRDARIIGITGAPGTGKSTLTDALISEMIRDGKKVGVLCVDPSSPFNRGALLGDRIRMSEWYNHPDVFIRSLASRGSLGGLNPRILEISEYMRGAGFDFIIVETVGVGQSEVEIAAVADMTIVVLVPESGDSIQSMKSGLMEIASVFVVNKSDRPGADEFYNDLKKMIGPVYKNHDELKPVFKVTATERKGTERLYQYITAVPEPVISPEKKELLAQKAFTMLQFMLMESIDEVAFKKELFGHMADGRINLFAFTKAYAEKINIR